MIETRGFNLGCDFYCLCVSQPMLPVQVNIGSVVYEKVINSLKTYAKQIKPFPNKITRKYWNFFVINWKTFACTIFLLHVLMIPWRGRGAMDSLGPLF